jgi:hypothetical protein
VIPALGRLRQEVCEFKASLEYIVRPVLSVKKKKKRRFEPCDFFRTQYLQIICLIF